MTAQFNEWFNSFRQSKSYQFLLHHPIAYFCAEFALRSDIPTYAGGLGVLAADLLQQAAREKIPFIGIGLYYYHGQAGNQTGENLQPNIEPSSKNFGLKLLIDDQERPVIISLPIFGQAVKAKVWFWQKETARLYLMDTNLLENLPEDRQITDQLYTPNKETRLKQETLLGIGGIYLLEALQVQPAIFHLNEGHSGLLLFELIKKTVQEEKVSFLEAIQIVKKKIVFTNHTLVTAGQEIFNTTLVSLLLGKLAEEIEVPISALIQLGLIPETNLFSLTNLCLKMSIKVNAVSRQHAQEAAKTWLNGQVEKITNGIFIPRWDKLQTENNLWKKHQENKKNLLKIIKEKTDQDWPPETLLVGWARRIVPYKRPLLIFQNPEKLKLICQERKRPMRLVFSGLINDEDEDGLLLLKRLKNLIANEFAGLAVFLPEYNLELAKKLVGGCDVWLNTPIIGMEACGTSGIKAALNGVLPLTTNDGWVDEVNLTDVGWVTDNHRTGEELINILEQKVIPLYYQQVNGENRDWEERMTSARKLVFNYFSTARVLKEYLEKLYLPTLNF